ncbi:MAG: diaminopropionate ammonia-lyase, partial [Longimicrobiales bacterium]
LGLRAFFRFVLAKADRLSESSGGAQREGALDKKSSVAPIPELKSDSQRPPGFFAMKYTLNSRAQGLGLYPKALQEVISLDAHRAAATEITSWDGYSPTPLASAPGLAREMGVKAVRIKDESTRFGLKSFKALGGAYGVFHALQAHAEPGGLTVTCASDGNHGRAVAWGARKYGCRAHIFLPTHVTEVRAEAIRALGATVERVQGEYDDAVAKAAELGESPGYTVVSDTSYEGYDRIPRLVMQGYTVMAAETLEQLGGSLPSHVFIQGGVGGLAAAVLGHLWEVLGADLPRVVLVEPETADPLYQSALNGSVTASSGSLETVMAGLSCREASPVAWAVLGLGAYGFMTVADDGIHPLMRRLASGELGEAIEAGESGVAGLLGALAASQDPGLRDLLGLDGDSQVLAFNTEGATDPALYAKILDCGIRE